MVATVATGFLKPGSVEFAGIPVLEVRLMNSEKWGDYEYILGRPYAEIRDALGHFVKSRCRVPQDNREALAHATCRLTETAEGMYLESDSPGGIWMHPEHHDPQRTVYAEVWAD